MKNFVVLCILLFCSVSYSSATLVDSIVTISWSSNATSPIVDRFLTRDTQIQLRLTCREPTSTTNPNNALGKAQVQIRGRVGRIVGCLPLESTTLMASGQPTSKDKDAQVSHMLLYENLLKQMEIRTFTMQPTECEYSGELFFDEYANITGPEISPEKVAQWRDETYKQERNQKGENAFNNVRRRRRAAVKDEPTEKPTPLTSALSKQLDRRLRTWSDGYYFIEIFPPLFLPASAPEADVDVIVTLKNRHGGYITADEYPALIFYGVMCGIYALFAVFWFVWCACYWRELLKIQFWIGGVIFMGLVEKSAYLAEYDIVNRHGYKVHVGIITAEVLSCLKRTISRMLVIIVALGYGIVKPRLGPLKQKVLAMGILYFGVSMTEAALRLNTKNDETSRRVLIARIPVAVVDAIVFYWIFTGLVATTRTLRLRNNIVKLNVYRHFTNILIFAILASLLFMIWSLKSHSVGACVTDWKEFWVDDAFWHILFSLILLVIMFLFRPSNNNQRYAFVPLLDQSDNDNDEFNDDEERGEAAVFDSVTLRNVSNVDSVPAPKAKKQQQTAANREANFVEDASNKDAVEDALAWVEHNIPTSLADQALQALDSEDEIVNTKLERSKMQ